MKKFLHFILKELNNPPENFKDLAENRDPPLRNNFLDNTLPLNNSFAFGSVSVDKEVVEHRKNVCKINGEVSFRVSDLYAAKNQKPLFGQMYCIDPEEALKSRFDMLDAEKIKKEKKVKMEVLQILDRIMQEHPLAKTYRTADQLYKDELKQRASKCKGVPCFRVVA